MNVPGGPDGGDSDKKTWLEFAEFIWQPVALAVLSGALVLVFLPFFPVTSLVALAALVLSVVIGIRGVRRGRMPVLILALCIGVAGLAWATLGVFILQPGRVYCYVASSIDPFAAAVEDVGRDGSRLFVVADPIRGSAMVRRIVDVLGRGRVTFLSSRRYGQEEALLIPLSAAVSHSVPGTSEITSSTQYLLSYYGPRLDIALTEGQLDVAPGVIYIRIIDVVERTLERPWRAVVHAAEQERDTAFYVTYLDVGLSNLAAGRFDYAIEALDRAFPFAPTARERSRVSTLLAGTSFAMLAGNVGELQSLGYYNLALQEWSTLWKEEPLDESRLKDPVDRWLFPIFQAAFLERQAQFREWTRLLKLEGSGVKARLVQNIGRETRSIQGVLGPRAPEQTVIDAEVRQMVGLIGASGDTQALERDVKRRLGWTSDVRRWLAETLLWSEEPLDPAHDHVAAATDWAIAQLDDPWRKQYQHYRLAERPLKAFLRIPPGQLRQSHLEIAHKVCSDLGFPHLARTFEAWAAFKEDSAEFPQFPNPGEAPRVAWWERSFQDWFAARIMSLIPDFVRACRSLGGNCAETLRRSAPELITDRSAVPHRFVPGIGLMIGFSQVARQPVAEEWRILYREAVGAEHPPLADAPQ